MDSNELEPDTIPSVEDPDIQALEERLEHVTIAVSSSEELEVTRVPEKLPDLPEFTVADPTDWPESYKSNTPKEKLVVGFVRNFERQFKQLYPQRKPLWTVIRNECGVEKFVCTTIRPTLLPYKELYSYQGAAQFVSDYLIYAQNKTPVDPPTQLVSPATTLWRQQGSSFDFSVLLCSLLEGAGYNAYCVQGYASKEVTTMDRARAVMQPDAPAAQAAAGAAAAPANKYAFKCGKTFESKFEEKMAKKSDAASAPAAAAAAAADAPADALHGLRVHCWVLVLPGKRDVPEPFFIEASTGQAVSPTDASYLGIEAVFNSKNYWVNMQSCTRGLGGIVYDLVDTMRWEFIFPNAGTPTVAPNVSGLEEETKNPELAVLDLPPSWVPALELTPKAYETRCPNGTKTIVYSDAVVELHAEYLREDGLVRRVTKYESDAKKKAVRIQETFLNRKDKLLSRVVTAAENKTELFYAPGHKFFIRKHTIIEGKKGPTHQLSFYHNSRSDGLETRTFTSGDLTEVYVARSDRLKSRRKSSDPSFARRPSGTGKPSRVMIETYERNPAIRADEDPASIVYDDEAIHVTYHIDDQRIAAAVREFEKPGLDEKGMPKPITTELVKAVKVDPKSAPDRNFALFGAFETLLKQEKQGRDAVAAARREMDDIEAARMAAADHVDLAVTFYDTARNVDAKLQRQALEIQAKEEAARREELEKDYLAPYLVQLDKPESLTAADAVWVKETCLKDLKDRLVDRAARTQQWLETEQAELAQKNEWLRKNQASIRPEEEERHRTFCEETAFRIKILQQRLVRIKETAPIKYVALETRLRKDPRLVKFLA
eukprot:m.16102 g.16102  ORF g.16102 m.16102 type:complete len:829 (-) comp6815_c0_seq1:122-2608(-)